MFNRDRNTKMLSHILRQFYNPVIQVTGQQKNMLILGEKCILNKVSAVPSQFYGYYYLTSAVSHTFI